MALPATHLRFAAAIAGRLKISDRSAYLSGTLYPDRRWVTGIDRRRTHDPRFLDPAFAGDDFTLGWHVHCVCDHLQGVLHEDLIGDLASLDADARWVRLSAAKVIQDMHDARMGDLGNMLDRLNDHRAPNGEPIEKIAAYLGFVRRAYRSPHTPRWEDYARLWEDVGLDPSLVVRIEAETRRMAADTALIQPLHGVCDRMMDRFSAD